MVIKLDDLTHPKNHYCDYCKTPAGSWCVTSGGKIRWNAEKQHVNRIDKAVEFRMEEALARLKRGEVK